MPKRPSKKPRAPVAGFTPQQVAAGVAARDRAATGNPRVVRGAFLGGQPIKLGGLEIQPLTIGTFWLLEETGNPIAVASSAQGEAATVTFRQLAEAAFILTDPLGASEALGRGKEVFVREAFALAAKVPISEVEELTRVLFDRAKEAQETMPPPDAAAGTNPSEPPAKTQV